jgi:hypothetical protein
MTTQRERALTYLLLGGIVLGGLGFFGFQFLLKPLFEADARLAELTTEVETKQDEVKKIQAKLPQLAAMRKISLPSDVMSARRQYEELLSNMGLKADFVPGSMKINFSEPDTKNSPQLALKKPAYTRLIYTLQARGDEHAVVEFLKLFYKEPLLHQIRKIAIQRPQQLGAQTKTNELTLDATIEALVVDNAENRKTLQPEKAPETLPNGMARPEEAYASITGKNVFFGPPPVIERTRSGDENVSDIDMTQFIYLTDIATGDGWTQAGFFDRIGRRMYVSRMTSDGNAHTEYFRTVGEHQRWKSWDKTKANALRFYDEDGQPLHNASKQPISYQIVKITPGEVIVRKLDRDEVLKRAMMATFGAAGQPVRALNEIDPMMRVPERLYHWPLEKNLASIKPLTQKEAAALGFRTGADEVLEPPPPDVGAGEAEQGEEK